MADLDFGMAMVAARIASSEAGKERQSRELGERRPPLHDARKGSDPGKPSLPGVKMEAVNGQLFLLPAAGVPRRTRETGWTPERREGKVIRLGTGEGARTPVRRGQQGPG